MLLMERVEMDSVRRFSRYLYCRRDLSCTKTSPTTRAPVGPSYLDISIAECLYESLGSEKCD